MINSQDIHFYLNCISSSFFFSSSKDYPFETIETYVVSIDAQDYRFDFEMDKETDNVSIAIHAITPDGNKFIGSAKSLAEMAEIGRIISRMNNIAADAAAIAAW